MTAKALPREPTEPSGNAWVIQTRLAAASRYNRWIHDLLRPHVGRRVLDAGCGLGNITQFFLDCELVVAVELREDFCQFIREQFADHTNLEVVQASLTGKSFRDLASRRIDSVICTNVLEHMEDDRAALANFAAVLAPGGSIALFTPGLPWLYGSMDAADDHFRRYTPEDLRVRLAQTGFDVEHQQWVNPGGILAWWLNGKVLRKPFVSQTNYGLFDRLVPLLRAAERICRPPIGLSVLTVGRRRQAP